MNGGLCVCAGAPVAFSRHSERQPGEDVNPFLAPPASVGGGGFELRLTRFKETNTLCFSTRCTLLSDYLDTGFTGSVEAVKAADGRLKKLLSSDAKTSFCPFFSDFFINFKGTFRKRLSSQL